MRHQWVGWWCQGSREVCKRPATSISKWTAANEESEVDNDGEEEQEEEDLDGDELTDAELTESEGGPEFTDPGMGLCELVVAGLIAWVDRVLQPS